MKRDMDLCRAIMQEVANNSAEWVRILDINIEGTSREDVRGHVSLLLDDQFLRGESTHFDGAGVRAIMGTSVSNDYNPHDIRPSSMGHDFLESSKGNVWKWVKSTAFKIPGVTFSMLLPLMTTYAKNEAEKLGFRI